MLAFQVNVNIFLIAVLILVAAVTGYLVRSNQLNSLKKRIAESEKEILASHAEILQLQRDKIDLIKTSSEPAIPVISMPANKEEKIAERMPDAASRLKLLGTLPAVNQQSRN